MEYFLGVFFFFFFKQKTAYDISVRDWSSDVCSSDLNGEQSLRAVVAHPGQQNADRRGPGRLGHRSEERREGKSVNACVDLGGRRIIKKKKKKEKKKQQLSLNQGELHTKTTKI